MLREGESGKSVEAAWHDDGDDDDIFLFMDCERIILIMQIIWFNFFKVYFSRKECLAI